MPQAVVTLTRQSELGFLFFRERLIGNRNYTIGVATVTYMEIFWLQSVAPT